MKQQALAGKARAKTGTAPLKNPLGPSVFKIWTKTWRVDKAWPSVAEKYRKLGFWIKIFKCHTGLK